MDEVRLNILKAQLNTLSQVNPIKAMEIQKSIQDELSKSRSGVYKDNAENRKLGRIGQHYGGETKDVEFLKEGETVSINFPVIGKKSVKITSISPYSIKYESDGSEKSMTPSEFEKYSGKKLPKEKEGRSTHITEDYNGNKRKALENNNESDFKIINDASSVSALMTPIWGNKSKGFLYFTDGLRVDIPTINERLDKSGDRKLVSLLDITGTNGENQQDPHTFKNDKVANSFSVRVNKKGRFELLQHKID